jgi:hypothetical protein
MSLAFIQNQYNQFEQSIKDYIDLHYINDESLTEYIIIVDSVSSIILGVMKVSDITNIDHFKLICNNIYRLGILNQSMVSH